MRIRISMNKFNLDQVLREFTPERLIQNLKYDEERALLVSNPDGVPSLTVVENQRNLRGTAVDADQRRRHVI